MASSGDLRVTAGGRVSLPAEVCARWNLGDGGQVVYLDLGDALLLVPSAASHRRRLLGAVTEAEWQAAAAGFGDPDLADE
ncbi:MAG: AbrB/MazE/SpoVT family DNA-binding domain-containing protein [Actinomycetota bacterium]|nr:AbrB/MazE/SpoVT family DNA-binding domain-containing protein [Actinomycetota bacterium]